MPLYSWTCNDCETVWEEWFAMSEIPEHFQCLDCGKELDRDIGMFNPVFGQSDLDFQTVRSRYEKKAIYGWDKDSANKFLKGSIAASKDRMATGGDMYLPLEIDYDYLHKKKTIIGNPRGLDGNPVKPVPLPPNKKLEKIKRSKKLTEEAYKKSGLDITKPQKQQ